MIRMFAACSFALALCVFGLSEHAASPAPKARGFAGSIAASDAKTTVFVDGLTYGAIDIVQTHIYSVTVALRDVTTQRPVGVQSVGVSALSQDVVLEHGSVLLLSNPTITSAQIERILAQCDPQAGATAPYWMEGWRTYGINPAIALAFFIHESSCATDPNWAGWMVYPSQHTYNVGNIICDGSSPYWDGTCFNRFRQYTNYRDGILDWYHLIATEYIQRRGHRTVQDVIPIYAPAFENNVNGYINTVDALVTKWADE